MRVSQPSRRRAQEHWQQLLGLHPRVVHELKEAQVQRQMFLWEGTVGSQPRAQQRPNAFQGVDMDLMEAVA